MWIVWLAMFPQNHIFWAPCSQLCVWSYMSFKIQLRCFLRHKVFRFHFEDISLFLAPSAVCVFYDADYILPLLWLFLSISFLCHSKSLQRLALSYWSYLPTDPCLLLIVEEILPCAHVPFLPGTQEDYMPLRLVRPTWFLVNGMWTERLMPLSVQPLEPSTISVPAAATVESRVSDGMATRGRRVTWSTWNWVWVRNKPYYVKTQSLGCICHYSNACSILIKCRNNSYNKSSYLLVPMVSGALLNVLCI